MQQPVPAGTVGFEARAIPLRRLSARIQLHDARRAAVLRGLPADDPQFLRDLRGTVAATGVADTPMLDFTDTPVGSTTARRASRWNPGPCHLQVTAAPGALRGAWFVSRDSLPPRPLRTARVFSTAACRIVGDGQRRSAVLNRQDFITR
jgi:hypothetical protein